MTNFTRRSAPRSEQPPGELRACFPGAPARPGAGPAAPGPARQVGRRLREGELVGDRDRDREGRRGLGACGSAGVTPVPPVDPPAAGGFGALVFYHSVGAVFSGSPKLYWKWSCNSFKFFILILFCCFNDGFGCGFVFLFFF